MAHSTQIEWTESTWNPVTGCTKVSAGCKHCYAENLARRLQAMGHKNYVNGFKVTLHPESLNLPFTWKKPQRIFVNSMSDLFHEDIPDSFIYDVFEVMCNADWHQYQILTKRSARMMELSKKLPAKEHIWLGVTVENNDYLNRLDDLRNSNTFIRFVSFEPLLGPIINPDLSNIDWAIVGGESGSCARPMDEDWVIKIKNACKEYNTAFFFKQWGGRKKKEAGRILQGRTWDEMPRNVANLAY